MKKPIGGEANIQDDFNVVKKTDKEIEELYSTPNKIRQHLKTTPQGFGSFFSPISKLSESDNSNTKMSPIDPRNMGTEFQTSTPTKVSSPTRGLLAEEIRNKLRITESGSRSSGNSPANSGRSTPRGIFEPQTPRNRHSWAANNVEIPQTCSDRLGTPKTSLMDFKRLLLSKSTTASNAKKSAVEQLKLTKSLAAKPQQAVQPLAAAVQPVGIPTGTTATATANSSMNILDLSGSPKTFATRRMIRQGQFGAGSSPSKTLQTIPVKHMSPRSGWRFNNLRSDVISTAIPEVQSEEDNSSLNSSNSRSSDSQNFNTFTTTDVSPATPPPPSPPLSSSPLTVESLPTILSPSPFQQQSSPGKIDNLYISEIVEENINVRDNIFMRADENNYMKGEVPQKFGSWLGSRAQLQTQRTNFLLGNNNNNNTSTNKNIINNNNINNNNNIINNNNKPSITATFKNGHYTGLTTTTSGAPGTQQTTITTTNSATIPSLETAL